MTNQTFIMCKPDAVERGLVGEIVTRFERKGRFKEYMQAIPTKVILHKQAALLGAARVAFNEAG